MFQVSGEGKGDRPELILADPTKLESIHVFESTFPVAMDLEAAIDAAEDAGPRFGDGLRYMLRSNRFELPSQLVFSTFRSRKDTRRAHSWVDVHTAHVEAGS